MSAPADLQPRFNLRRFLLSGDGWPYLLVPFIPLAVVLEHIDDAQALLVMIEATRHQRVDHALAGVAKRRVAEVVAERDRFGELLVQP